MAATRSSVLQALRRQVLLQLLLRSSRSLERLPVRPTLTITTSGAIATPLIVTLTTCVTTTTTTAAVASTASTTPVRGPANGRSVATARTMGCVDRARRHRLMRRPAAAHVNRRGWRRRRRALRVRPRRLRWVLCLLPWGAVIATTCPASVCMGIRHCLAHEPMPGWTACRCSGGVGGGGHCGDVDVLRHATAVGVGGGHRHQRSPRLLSDTGGETDGEGCGAVGVWRTT